MPFSTERTALIKAKLGERLSNDILNDWERSFLTDVNGLCCANRLMVGAPLSPDRLSPWSL